MLDGFGVSTQSGAGLRPFVARRGLQASLSVLQFSLL
jgi:hypothetical protein